MNDILKTFVSLSLSGTLLIIVLFLCKVLWKEKTSKRWQYYIWLIVIARLLLPFTPETSLVGSMFHSVEQTIVAQKSDVSATIQSNITLPLDQSEGMANSQTVTPTESNKSGASCSLASILAVVERNLWLVWLFVAVVLLIRKITIYQGFAKYMKAGNTEVSNIELLDRLAEIGVQIGVKRPTELYTNSLISSPLLIGFFRPSIVLPTADLSANDFYYTILHELLHFKRKDMFYKWLVQFTICFHWFNPFVYWMGQEVNRTCELACDEAVIKNLNSSGQREYGDTLLNAFGCGGSYRDTIASVTLHESKELLKERLCAIMDFTNPLRFKKFTSACLTLALCCGAMLTGAYATAPYPVLEQKNVQATSSDRISPTQVDEMAFALINKTWVWDWIAFFVPYMSEEGVSQIVAVSESSEWVGTMDYSTMTAMKPFSHAQVYSARNVKTRQNDLTRSDIDIHAQMIMQSNGSWQYIDFMIPYMTNHGIKQVQEIYAGKQGGQSSSAYSNFQTNVINLASNGQQNITKSGSFEAKANQRLILTIESDITGGTVDFFLFSPTGKEQRITIGDANNTEIINLAAGRWAYNCTGFFKNGEITILGQLNSNEQPSDSSTSSMNSIDISVLELMKKTGNWNYVKPFLPNMTKHGIDAVVNCYNSKHPNVNEHKRASNYYNELP